jgi:uncharacterized protein YdcH (DUF465 family)
MAIIKMNILAVNECFPEYKTIIKRLYRKDEIFRSICEDYQSCCEALKRWDLSEAEEAPIRRNEYTDLMQDLELEILQYLGEHEHSQ